MFFLTKQLVRSFPNVVLNKSQFVRTHKGGIPGCVSLFTVRCLCI